MEQLYTVKEAMGLLKISRATLYRLIAQGELRPVKIGRKVLFPEGELKGFLRRLKKKG